MVVLTYVLTALTFGALVFCNGTEHETSLSPEIIEYDNRNLFIKMYKDIQSAYSSRRINRKSRREILRMQTCLEDIKEIKPYAIKIQNNIYKVVEEQTFIEKKCNEFCLNDVCLSGISGKSSWRNKEANVIINVFDVDNKLRNITFTISVGCACMMK